MYLLVYVVVFAGVLFVCLCVFPLGVIASLGVSSRLGLSVCAVGVGVCERPLRVLVSEY